MKMTLLAVILISSLGAASAQAACEAFEYAELKDMSKELLITKFCDYRSDTYAWINEASVASKTVGMTVANRYMAISNRCSHEWDRVERILDQKFQIKQPSCTKTTTN